MVDGSVVGINGRRREGPGGTVIVGGIDSAAAAANRAARDREITCARCDDTFVPRGRSPKDAICPRCRVELERPKEHSKAARGEVLGGRARSRPVPAHLAISADDAIDGRIEACNLDYCPFDEIHRAHESLDGLRGPRRVDTSEQPGAPS